MARPHTRPSTKGGFRGPFIDELDSFNSPENDSKHGEWWRRVIKTLLEELDGTMGRDAAIMVGATNYPGNLDPALKRSGRLDREIEIGLPDADALGWMFQVYHGDALPLASLAVVVLEAD